MIIREYKRGVNALSGSEGLLTLLWWRTLAGVAVVVVGMVAPAHATFHLIQIEQILGGVAGDNTAQAIQLRSRAAGQGLVAQGKLVVVDAAGANPVTIVDLAANVANGNLGDRILICSANFTNYTSSAITPDFLMTSLIPASYLAAGSLIWENDAGTQILWRFSWGGPGYTGSNLGLVTNDADGNFGPPFPAALPSTGVSAALFTNSASALSRSNIVDYVVTVGPAVFANNVTNTVAVVTDPNPRILSIAATNNDVAITWKLIGGKTNVVQATNGEPLTGSYTTNGFSNLSGNIVGAGIGESVTNFIDAGGALVSPTRYYRVRMSR